VFHDFAQSYYLHLVLDHFVPHPSRPNFHNNSIRRYVRNVIDTVSLTEGKIKTVYYGFECGKYAVPKTFLVTTLSYTNTGNNDSV
jgi:hypothetical protein